MLGVAALMPIRSTDVIASRHTASASAYLPVALNALLRMLAAKNHSLGRSRLPCTRRRSSSASPTAIGPQRALNGWLHVEHISHLFISPIRLLHGGSCQDAALDVRQPRIPAARTPRLDRRWVRVQADDARTAVQGGTSGPRRHDRALLCRSRRGAPLGRQSNRRNACDVAIMS